MSYSCCFFGFVFFCFILCIYLFICECGHPCNHHINWIWKKSINIIYTNLWLLIAMALINTSKLWYFSRCRSVSTMDIRKPYKTLFLVLFVCSSEGKFSLRNPQNRKSWIHRHRHRQIEYAIIRKPIYSIE